MVAVAPAPPPARCRSPRRQLRADRGVRPRPQPAPSTRDTSLYEAADMQASDEAPRPHRCRARPFAQQNVGGTRKRVRRRADLAQSLKDADIKDVLRSFAKISGLNVVIQPGVRGTVTVELESVPWDQALDQILKINNLGYELDGNIMRIAPRTVLENEAKEQQALAQAQALSIPLRTVIKRLSYSSAGRNVADPLDAAAAAAAASSRSAARSPSTAAPTR